MQQQQQSRAKATHITISDRATANIYSGASKMSNSSGQWRGLKEAATGISKAYAILYVRLLRDRLSL